MARRGLLLFVVGLLSGCTSLGLPRTPVSAESPDHRFVAFVRNHPSIDPPDQSVWLTDRSGATSMLRKLGGDTEWCNRIVWSGDSTVVGFLIMDARLDTYDVVTRVRQASVWLNGNNGDYPPTGTAVDLALSADGRSATFKACGRGAAANDCSDTRHVELVPPGRR